MCSPTGALLHAHDTADVVWPGVPGQWLGGEGNPGRNEEIPNVPAARHYTAQDNGLVQPWGFQEVLPGTS